MSINSVVNDTVTGESVVNALKPKPPAISGYTISGVDDTALDPAGGQTILLNGTGFQRGATVTLNGTAISVVTYVNANQLSFTSPAVSAGTYTIYAVNADGGTGIYIPGLIYSNLPTWTTGAGSLGSYYETQTIASNVVASGDAPVTYSLFSGALPAGAVFNANGTISGSAPVDGGSTTYSFTVRATDAQLQDSNRSFTLTINTDVVSWTTPNASATYTPTVNSVMANIGLTATSAAGAAVTYSANSLPTGVSLSGNTISGTPTSTGSSSTLLTATATATSRSATRTINWTIAVASDSYFGYNTLLLQGADTFVKDASSNNFAVTIAGDIKPNSFNPYTPGYYSNYFDGSGDWIAFPENALVLGASNFTFEAWIYPTATGQMTVINGQTNAATVLGSSFSFNINGDACYLYSGSSLTYSITSPTATVNAWSHVSFVRTGNTFSTYLNGTRISTTAGIGSSVINTGILGHHAKIGINGGVGATSYTPFTGYISNLRGIIGSGGYDATQTSITVPTSPLSATANTILLTCQSNRFIDNSATPLTLTVAGDTKIKSFQPFTPNTSYSTYGSGYFDGTGDYLSLASNAVFTVGTGAVTIEAWIYCTSLTQPYQGIIGGRLQDGASYPGLGLVIDNSKLFFTIMGISTGLVDTDNVSLNQWIHVVGVRSGTNAALFVNGVRKAFSASNSTNGSSSNMAIGRYYSADDGYYFSGYISDARIVKGTAVYDPTVATFTPPATPLTAIANTSLLTLQNNQSANNNVFLDNSTNNFFVTRNGNTTQGTFSPYGGNWSNYFDGTGDSLTVPTNAALDFGTGDFTVECWVYLRSLNVPDYVPIFANSYLFYVGKDGEVLVFNGSVNVATGTAGDVGINTWTHIAYSRSSSVLRIYVNGVQKASATVSASIGSASPNRIAVYSTVNLNGYISNLRVVKGTAVYTSAFTPSTTPLTAIANTSLLTCADNRIIDDSINNFAITRNGDVSVQRFSPFNPSIVTPTSYSGYFDGTGDYLSTPSSSNFALGAGDFTIECWIYVTAAFGTSGSGRGAIISNRTAASSETSYTLQHYNGKLYFGTVTTDVWPVGGNTTMSINTWYHVAVTRSSGIVRLFLNGVSDATPVTGNTTNFSDTSAVYIGCDGSYGGPLYQYTGYISNARIVKGTAVYTSAFTPSTTPLTSIANTSLLTCQSASFVDNSANNFAITAAGNSQPSQQNPFGFASAATDGYTLSTVGGSAYFDTNLDYLNAGVNSAYSFGSGDFTIESWVYITARGSSGSCFAGTWAASGRGWIWISTPTQHGFVYSTNGTNETAILATYTIPLNTWTHLATVRNGNTITNYANGVSIGTGSVTGVTISTPTQPLYIGANKQDVDSSINNYQMTGYMSDFRIVKGQALYTGNFVPPSAPQTAVQNTSLLLNMTSAGVYDASTQNNLETVGDARLSTAVSKFGGSSMSFDGTGDYLTRPNDPLFDLSSGDFTIEFWFNTNTLTPTSSGSPGYANILAKHNWNGSSGAGWGIWQFNQTIVFFWPTSTLSSFSTGNVITATGTWYHVAIVRSGTATNNTKIYINGVQQAQGTPSVTNSTQPFTVGGTSTATGWDHPYMVNGYIDDLRFTKGYARYTANFTPPTEQFMIK